MLARPAASQQVNLSADWHRTHAHRTVRSTRGRQRRRLEQEQAERKRLDRDVFPLDEKFLAALDRIGESGGVAVGFDRLLMLLIGARTIAEVLLFPAAEEYGEARRPR